MADRDHPLKHRLATALRDVTLHAALFEQNPSDEHRRNLNAALDEADVVLTEFVNAEGDILPPVRGAGV